MAKIFVKVADSDQAGGMSDTESYDVVIIGGGAAGLTGAVALARSRRSVLLVDAGDPRNAPAGHVHNFLTRDGMPPAEIYDRGRAEVTRYGGQVVAARVSGLAREEAGFEVTFDGRSVAARRLLVATGLRDELPDLPGLRERWGIDVLHCPYCHGWEVRDRRIGVLATGPMSMHQALLFRQLSPSVVFLRHTGRELSGEEAEQLAALGIELVDGVVEAVESSAAGLTGVRLTGGNTVDLEVLVVAPRFTARAELLAPLGLEPVDFRVGDHLAGTRIETDPTGRTAVAGVWAAGNVTELQAQVMGSAAAGLTAGAAINIDIITEDAGRAVAEHRLEQLHSEAAWEERYKSRAHIWSGEPNPTLVTEVTPLSPGSALDVGCGEGADAIWLAARGWTVTGVDLSPTALARAAEHGRQRGVEVTWQHLDLTRTTPDATYDLVTAHFLHLPRERRRVVFADLMAAVAPGGTLLIVGHDPSDIGTTMPRHHLAEMGWTVAEIVESLGEEWTIDVAEARPRSAVDPEGRTITIHDAVLRARRS